MKVLTPDLAEVHGSLTRALGTAFTRSESRPGDLGLSLSKLGGCTREAAYRLAGTAPDEGWRDRQGQKRPAALGTFQHRGLLPRLRLALRRARTEVPVQLAGSGVTLTGSVDTWWRRPASKGGHGVVDVKTVREWGLGWVRDNGRRPRDGVQVDAYAMGLRNTYQAPVSWTAVVYLDRAGGDEHIDVQPFGPAQASSVLNRLEEVASSARNPSMATRDERGPGLSIICDGCPWLKQCWGEQAEPGRPGGQSVLLDEGIYSVTQALEMYDSARELAKEGEEDKAFARAMLLGTAAGDYGGYSLRWGRSSPGGAIAKAKAWDALMSYRDLPGIAADLGVVLPLTEPRAGAISVGKSEEGS